MKASSFFNLKLLYAPNLEVLPLSLSSCAKINNSASCLPVEWIAFKNPAWETLIKMDSPWKHCIERPTPDLSGFTFVKRSVCLDEGALQVSEAIAESNSNEFSTGPLPVPGLIYNVFEPSCYGPKVSRQMGR